MGGCQDVASVDEAPAAQVVDADGGGVLEQGGEREFERLRRFAVDDIVADVGVAAAARCSFEICFRFCRWQIS